MHYSSQHLEFGVLDNIEKAVNEFHLQFQINTLLGYVLMIKFDNCESVTRCEQITSTVLDLPDLVTDITSNVTNASSCVATSSCNPISESWPL